jgi:hypothetical protein
VGEAIVAAPTVLLVVAAMWLGRWVALFWVPAIGMAWWLRDGRASCIGCMGSVVAGGVLSSLLATPDRSLITLLGAFCILWTWWVGAIITGNLRVALVDELANSAGLYALLRAEGSIRGPEHADVRVVTHGLTVRTTLTPLSAAQQAVAAVGLTSL